MRLIGLVANGFHSRIDWRKLEIAQQAKICPEEGKTAKVTIEADFLSEPTSEAWFDLSRCWSGFLSRRLLEILIKNECPSTMYK